MTETKGKRMRNKIWLAIGASFLLATTVLLVRATEFTFLGSMVTVDTTTSNSPAASVGTFTVPRGALYLAHGALTATNNLPVKIQLSLDGTNFITVSTNWPSSTNATAATPETIWPAFTGNSVYMRISVTTTNSVEVGATYSY
jgi:hypothetical protein